MNAHVSLTDTHQEGPPPHPIGDKPLTFRSGSVSVKIYGTWNKSRSRSENGNLPLKFSPQYKLDYYLGNKRKSQKFSDLSKAKAEANRVLVQLANADGMALKLTGRDRARYVDAIQNLKRLTPTPSIEFAVIEYVSAKEKIQPLGATLDQVVDDYLKRYIPFKTLTVPELVAEFISVKEGAGLSDEYLNSIRRLKRFGSAFDIPTAELTYEMLQGYVDSLEDRHGAKASPRTKKNYWQLIRTCLRFAVKRKYVPKDLLDAIQAVELPKVPPSKTEIWSPDDLEEMLHACRPKLVPWLAIAAFAGVRTAEIKRLDWSDVKLDRKLVTVSAQDAKTRSRRVIPLCDAAVAWLKPHDRNSGKLACYAEENKFQKYLQEDVNAARDMNGDGNQMKWKRNGFRHSFCSYRLATLKNVDEVAIEAGNSVDIIFKNYRELVSEEDSKRWFGIDPDTSQKNIIHFKNAG